MNYNLDLRLRAAQDRRLSRQGGPLNFEPLRQWAHNHPQWEDTWIIRRVVRPSVYDLETPDESDEMRAVRCISLFGSDAEVGNAVRVGFYGGRRDDPFIYAILAGFKEEGGGEGGIVLRDWTHFLGDAGRRNSVSFGFSPASFDIYVPICAAWVSGEAVYRQARVLQETVYANLLGGGLAKLNPSVTYNDPFEAPAWGHGLTPTDLFIDQASNSIYVQHTSNGMIRRGSALDLTTTWSSPVLGAGFETIPLCLGFHRSQQIVACLCRAPHPQDPRPFLWMQGFKAADGERVFSVVLLQEPEPPFAPNEVVPLVTWHSQFEYWNRNGDPGIRWSDHRPGSNTIGSPWARSSIIDRTTIGNTSPAGTFSNQPTQDWGAVPGQALDSRVRTGAGPNGSVSNDSVIIPSCFTGVMMPMLVAYNLHDGSKAWEAHGATTTEAEGQSQFRDWFLPRMIVGNQLIVVTRKHEFLTNDVDFRIFGEDVVPQYDESITYSNGTHPWYGDRATPKLVEIQQRRCRVQKSVHFYLETFDVRDGRKLSSVRMYNKTFTSLFHLRGEWIGSLGAPYWRTLLDDNLEYPYDGPTYLERYGPTGRAPNEVVDPVNVGEKFYWAVGADGNEFVVLQARRFAYRRSVQGSGGSVYRGDTQHTYSAREFSGSWDLQDYPHLSTPILNTSRTKIVFARNPGNFSPLAGNYSHGQRKMDWLPGSNDWMSWSGGTQANGWENNVTITSPDLHRDRIHFQAFDLDPAAPSWRHTMIFPSGASVQIGLAACGAGGMVIPYTLAGVRRLRVLDDNTGQQLSDVVMQMPTGIAPGAPQYTILCGKVAILVSQGAIHSIKSTLLP